VSPSRREDLLLFLVTVVPGLALAIRATMQLHLYHSDNLARAYAAGQVIHGFEPKLTNLGFAWPQIPAMLQLPFAALVPSLIYQGVAGPIVSVLACSGCVLLLNRILDPYIPRRWVRFSVLLLFLANPLVLYLTLSGTAEMIYLAFILLSWWSFQRIWSQTPPPLTQVSVMGIAVSCAFLSRYEGAVYGVILGATLALMIYLRLSPHGRSITEGLMVIYLLPLMYVTVLLLIFNWIIVGNPLYFAVGQGSQSEVAANLISTQEALQALVGDPLAAARYVLQVSWYVFPLLFLVVPLAIARAIKKRDIVLAGLVFLALSTPLVQWYQHVSGQLAGYVRYYVSNVVFGLLLLIYATQPLALQGRRVLNASRELALVLVLAVGTMLPWIDLHNPSIRWDNLSSQDLEVILGLAPADAASRGAQERAISDYFSRTLFAREHDARVLVDDSEANAIILFSGELNHFVVPNTIRYPEIVADPVGTVDYILVPDLPPDQDLILEQYPGLFHDGAPFATLVKEFSGGPWTSVGGTEWTKWRLYRVSGE